VLIHGESGTGKELVAHALHVASGRPGRFAAINCAALPENLVESELFGFRRGAFSGAIRDHLGMVRSADHGTLLLDEIGDMPLLSQPKLLRTLETRVVFPIGDVHGAPVDVRVVGATHRDLGADVAAGRFRGDLLARLRGATVTIPPLRERREDLYPLVRHFLAASGAEGRAVTFRFMLAVVAYAWPYNVRELAAAVKRAVALAPDGPLDLEHLPAEVATAADEPIGRSVPPSSLREALSTRAGRPTARELTELLREHRGNVAAVARVLDKDRTQIHRWMQQLGIDPGSFR
jgi:DNA-binding NtrC family response regulator